jgi:hypothetical protein
MRHNRWTELAEISPTQGRNFIVSSQSDFTIIPQLGAVLGPGIFIVRLVSRLDDDCGRVLPSSEEPVVRVLRTRFFALLAFGLLPICVGGLSGCDSKPADGELVEEQHVDAQQKADVKAQYQKQRLERKNKSSTKGKPAPTRGRTG